MFARKPRAENRRFGGFPGSIYTQSTMDHSEEELFNRESRWQRK